jgi:hypothetical protein
VRCFGSENGSAARKPRLHGDVLVAVLTGLTGKGEAFREIQALRADGPRQVSKCKGENIREADRGAIG